MEKIEYKIEKRAYEALINGGHNFRVGCIGEYGVDCGGSAVHTSIKEVEDEIRNLAHFVGAEASGFYVMIDDDEDDEQPHEWLYCEID